MENQTRKLGRYCELSPRPKQLNDIKKKRKDIECALDRKCKSK